MKPLHGFLQDSRWWEDPPVNFVRHIHVAETTDQCWEWAGYRNPGGYGVWWKPGRPRRQVIAHRFFYECLFGDLPPWNKIVVDHLCRNTACCNPFHLEAVTHRENTMRGNSPSAAKAVATHCMHGHPFDEKNTSIDKRDGTRRCRRCNADREMARRKRLSK